MPKVNRLQPTFTPRGCVIVYDKPPNFQKTPTRYKRHHLCRRPVTPDCSWLWLAKGRGRSTRTAPPRGQRATVDCIKSARTVLCEYQQGKGTHRCSHSTLQHVNVIRVSIKPSGEAGGLTVDLEHAEWCRCGLVDTEIHRDGCPSWWISVSGSKSRSLRPSFLRKSLERR